MDAAKIDKLPPKEVYEKFSNHVICKRKCQIEKDALKTCIDKLRYHFAHLLLLFTFTV